MEAWSSTGFHIQHYNALVAQANIHLYEGEPERAWDLLTERWPALRRSLLLRVQPILITMLELRARTALARVAGVSAPRAQACLRSARADMKALGREGAPYGRAFVLKLQAQEALAASRWPEAAALCLQAEIAFSDGDMNLHALAVRRVRSRLEGPQGAGRLEEADQWLRDQGVIQPDRFVAMLFPVPGPKDAPAAFC
jgi:hypothetical protein